MMGAHRTGPVPRRPWAFTLIEMLTVIGIIVILAGILVPALLKAGGQTKRAACLALIRGLGQACTLYESECGFYPPDSLKENRSDPATAATGGYASVDTPSEALWFFLVRKFVYKSTETNFNERHASATHTFNTPSVYATKNFGPFFNASSGQLKDVDRDGVPEIVDVWNQPILYNAPGCFGKTEVDGSTWTPDWSAASLNPQRNANTFDIYSVGPNATTRRNDKTHSFSTYVLGAADPSTVFKTWHRYVMGSALDGNDTQGDGANSLGGTFKEEDQDDVNNWNTK
jgi:type II secretory pathway pseudopilin PulG